MCKCNRTKRSAKYRICLIFLSPKPCSLPFYTTFCILFLYPTNFLVRECLLVFSIFCQRMIHIIIILCILHCVLKSCHHSVFKIIMKVLGDMGQCPAKSGLWGYNFITIKIARCTKQHIFATVVRFPFKFRTLVPTPENRFL